MTYAVGSSHEARSTLNRISIEMQYCGADIVKLMVKGVTSEDSDCRIVLEGDASALAMTLHLLDQAHSYLSGYIHGPEVTGE